MWKPHQHSFHFYKHIPSVKKLQSVLKKTTTTMRGPRSGYKNRSNLGQSNWIFMREAMSELGINKWNLT